MSDEQLNRKIDWNALFKALRDLYRTQSGKTSLEIAQECNVRQQCLSSWCTGFGNRNPPNRLVLYLINKTNTKLVIENAEVFLKHSDDTVVGRFDVFEDAKAAEATMA